MNKSSNLWDRHQQQWNALGSPLRPCAIDLAIFNSAIQEWRTVHPDAPATAFVMGATPEFPQLDWPFGSKVFALDKSINMLRYIWPQHMPFATGGVVMDWLAMPVRDGSADIIIGDGCFTLVDWPDGYTHLLDIAARLLKPDGRLLMRFFVRPEQCEPVSNVFADLEAGSIGSFHSFKWRLAMAMQGEAPDVAVDDIWNEWIKRGIDGQYLVDRFGWTPESVETIHAYRAASQHLSFPGLMELLDRIETVIDVDDCVIPDYELGHCCPIISMKRKGYNRST